MDIRIGFRVKITLAKNYKNNFWTSASKSDVRCALRQLDTIKRQKFSRGSCFRMILQKKIGLLAVLSNYKINFNELLVLTKSRINFRLIVLDFQEIPEGSKKTQICSKWKDWKEGKSSTPCSYGKVCSFAHGEKELVKKPAPPAHKTQICEFWDNKQVEGGRKKTRNELFLPKKS